MGNSVGPLATTYEQQMAAYDALPLVVRRALVNTDHNWGTEPILDWWEQRGRDPVSASYIAQRIAQADAEKTKADAVTVWGRERA